MVVLCGRLARSCARRLLSTSVLCNNAGEGERESSSPRSSIKAACACQCRGRSRFSYVTPSMDRRHGGLGTSDVSYHISSHCHPSWSDVGLPLTSILDVSSRLQVALKALRRRRLLSRSASSGCTTADVMGDRGRRGVQNITRPSSVPLGGR